MQNLETERLTWQKTLDAERTPKERNELGQFATPTTLADDITQYALSLHGQTKTSRSWNPPSAPVPFTPLSYATGAAPPYPRPRR